MKTQPIYRYLTMAALLGIWSCSSSRQTAQNSGEVDDLYGSSANAVVYAGNSSDVSSVASRPTQRFGNRQQPQRFDRNTNPDYSVNEEQQGYNANGEEYYTELSTRKLNRGLSPDPGWNEDGTNAYNSGFVNGFNSAQTSALSWNRWGFNNMGFYNGLGLGLGLGMGGFGWGNGFNMGFGNPWGWGGGFNRFGGGFYDPFWGGGFGGFNSFAYSPWGFGGGFNNFGYGGFNPYWGGGGFFGGGFGNNVIVNNVNVVGADPYRSSRSYGPRGASSTNRYNDGFVNTPRTNNSGGRTGAYTGSSNAPVYTSNGRGGNSASSGYTAPNANSRGNSYYYDNNSGSSSRGGRAATGSVNTNTAPSYSSGRSNSDYYSTPRQNSRGSYTPPASSYGNSGARGSYGQPSTQARQPSYQSQQPSYSAPQRSYSQPSTPSYSAPSSGGSRGGGGGSPSGGGGGGSRGPR